MYQVGDWVIAITDGGYFGGYAWKSFRVVEVYPEAGVDLDVGWGTLFFTLDEIMPRGCDAYNI